jgi:hypothetical protein
MWWQPGNNFRPEISMFMWGISWASIRRTNKESDQSTASLPRDTMTRDHLPCPDHTHAGKQCAHRGVLSSRAADSETVALTARRDRRRYTDCAWIFTGQWMATLQQNAVINSTKSNYFNLLLVREQKITREIAFILWLQSLLWILVKSQLWLLFAHGSHSMIHSCVLQALRSTLKTISRSRQHSVTE